MNDETIATDAEQVESAIRQRLGFAPKVRWSVEKRSFGQPYREPESIVYPNKVTEWIVHISFSEVYVGDTTAITLTHILEKSAARRVTCPSLVITITAGYVLSDGWKANIIDAVARHYVAKNSETMR